ncbi:hypothetical protein [Micropruina sp.]|uniref:hypothetical protein n=1 Tax=Micropruina sp. TaxID=2737536 RepID=UPI0039E58F29
MTKLTAVPLLQDPPFATTVTADQLPAREPVSSTDPDWRHTRPVKPRAAAPGEIPSLDWSLVVLLRRKASELIAAAIAQHHDAHGVAMPEVDRRLLGRSLVRQVVRDHAEDLSSNGQALWPIALEQAYAEGVENAIFGYGRLQPLFEIADAENIEIHGHDSVMVQYGDGRREERPPVADSDSELVEAIRFLGESVTPARPFDDAHPTMTLAVSRNYLTSPDAALVEVLPLGRVQISPDALCAHLEGLRPVRLALSI